MMVAYNFKRQFADAVESGVKCQTIRPRRKDGGHAKPGQIVQLYTGMRTKSCRKLREAICHVSCEIIIDTDKVITFGPSEVFLGDDLERFARMDGFSCWLEMRSWFETAYSLPFKGHMIGWKK